MVSPEFLKKRFPRLQQCNVCKEALLTCEHPSYNCCARTVGECEHVIWIQAAEYDLDKHPGEGGYDNCLTLKDLEYFYGGGIIKGPNYETDPNDKVSGAGCHAIVYGIPEEFWNKDDAFFKNTVKHVAMPLENEGTCASSKLGPGGIQIKHDKYELETGFTYDDIITKNGYGKIIKEF